MRSFLQLRIYISRLNHIGDIPPSLLEENTQTFIIFDTYIDKVKLMLSEEVV